ncbi:MAG: paraslipin [Candidatus Pacearchaeota archaeon]|nr:paraslipin [Candidatus Pacearchaeota archaeon]
MLSYILITFVAIGVIIIFKMIKIIPEQEAFIIERFGEYQKTLNAGAHIIIPGIQRVAYKHSLKEEVIDVPPQMCITRDNVQVEVDGILYLRVVDPYKASYGIENYRFATAQIGQTTMRSEMGKIELDISFAERDKLNASIVQAVDEASDPWGIKVTRYEIKDITPSRTVQEAMEKQVRAEREKRAEILKSEGEKLSRINKSLGEKTEAVNLSEGERQRRINVSDGNAMAIELISKATATGIKEISKAIQKPKGKTAVSLRIAEQFILEFGHIISEADTSVLPADLANLQGVIRSLTGGTGNDRIVLDVLEGKEKIKEKIK